MRGHSHESEPLLVREDSSVHSLRNGWVSGGFEALYDIWYGQALVRTRSRPPGRLPQPLYQPTPTDNRITRKILWSHLSADGCERAVLKSKRELLRMLRLERSVRPRDLQVLDPAYASTTSGCIFVRDQCIIVALEHARLLILKDCVLVAGDCDCDDDQSCVSMEQSRLRKQLREMIVKHKAEGLHGRTASVLALKDMSQDLNCFPEGAGSREAGRGPGCCPVGAPRDGSRHADDSANHASTCSGAEPLNVPFERMVLDVALMSVCGTLTQRGEDVSCRARKLVDEFVRSVTCKISLDMREAKSEQQRVMARVSIVRDALQDLVGDERDLRKMCLRLQAHLADGTSPLPWNSTAAVDGCAASSYSPYNSLDCLSPAPTNRGPVPPCTDAKGAASGAACLRDGGAAQPAGVHLSEAAAGSFRGVPAEDVRAALETSAWSDKQAAAAGMVAAEMELTEALVESHLISIDAVYRRLRELEVYIRDAEDCVNITMDAVRNQLIKWETVLSTASFAIGIYALVAGILGENLLNPDPEHDMKNTFLSVNVIMLILCVCVFGLIMVKANRSGLI